MLDNHDRSLKRTSGYFVQGANFPAIQMGDLEGCPTSGKVELKPLLVGSDMLMVNILEPEGTKIPAHSHDDHESVVYLIKGTMKLQIADQEFTAQAGDAWIHPIGVVHSSEALEDCVAVEIKSPPRKTWNEA